MAGEDFPMAGEDFQWLERISASQPAAVYWNLLDFLDFLIFAVARPEAWRYGVRRVCIIVNAPRDGVAAPINRVRMI